MLPGIEKGFARKRRMKQIEIQEQKRQAAQEQLLVYFLSASA
jgi:hypothetical protein